MAGHALTQAETVSSGTADSFLRAAHIGKTRRANQITAAALNMLKHKAYDKHYCEILQETT